MFFVVIHLTDWLESERPSFKFPGQGIWLGSPALGVLWWRTSELKPFPVRAVRAVVSGASSRGRSGPQEEGTGTRETLWEEGLGPSGGQGMWVRPEHADFSSLFLSRSSGKLQPPPRASSYLGEKPGTLLLRGWAQCPVPFGSL